jgi:nucleotide-binding universal stress UspA family protein
LREIKPLRRHGSNNRYVLPEATMTDRSLLVQLDHQRLCGTRTRLAIRLAADLDCHLVGLAPTGLIDVPTTAASAAALSEYATLAWNDLRDQAHLAAQRFRNDCRDARLASFEAVVDEGDAAQSLVRHAHCSDLTVLSQADPDSGDQASAQAIVEQVVLHSARPTLIAPFAAGFERLGRTAMVAWDDSREAARAVSDALPLLRRAERVQVVSWNEKGVPRDATLHPRLDALHRWLMWHGVRAEIGVETTAIGIAEAMLSRAADLDADLIVMGAYGHARWAERMLGGATRGLLVAMTVPVLMSH